MKLKLFLLLDDLLELLVCLGFFLPLLLSELNFNTVKREENGEASLLFVKLFSQLSRTLSGGEVYAKAPL